MLYRNTWAAAKESNPLLRVWEKTSPGVGCKPQPETHLPYISQCPPLPHVQAIHLVLPLVACDPARKRSEDVFPCSFSHFFKENERLRRGGSGKRNERLVVLCKGGYEEINNSHYSQEGVKGKWSQSAGAGFSWLQQTPPGVIY